MNRLRPSSKSVLASLALAGVVALFVLILATAAYAGVWLPGQQSSEPVSAPTALDALYRPSVATLPVEALPAPKSKPKPTAAPVAAPAASAPAPPSVSVPSGSVQQRIAAAWPGDDRKVLCLVGRETGQTYNPYIKNPSGKYWGLFQADSAFRAAYGWAGWGVEEQVAMAWRGFQARGWQPWPPAAGC